MKDDEHIGDRTPQEPATSTKLKIRRTKYRRHTVANGWNDARVDGLGRRQPTLVSSLISFSPCRMLITLPAKKPAVIASFASLAVAATGSHNFDGGYVRSPSRSPSGTSKANGRKARRRVIEAGNSQLATKTALHKTRFTTRNIEVTILILWLANLIDRD